MTRTILTTFCMTLLTGLTITNAQTLEVMGSFQSTHKGQTLNWFTGEYREVDSLSFGIAKPAGYHPDAIKKYPLVLYLHGAGARGNDLSAVLQGRQTAREMAWHAQRADGYPAFVVAPQVRGGLRYVDSDWALGPYVQNDTTHSVPMMLTEGLIRHLLESGIPQINIDASDIDLSRVYVVGDSMGAYGAWDLIGRHPDLFAAAIAGAGSGPNNRIKEIRSTPIWVIHGREDNIVPNRLPSIPDTDGMGSLGMMGLLDPAYNNQHSTAVVYKDNPSVADDDPLAHDSLVYSELLGMGHGTVAQGWTTLVSGVIPWLFAQRQPARLNRGMAWKPVPADAADNLAADTQLAWTPGDLAVSHDIYFGTAMDNVLNANRANPLGTMVSEQHDANAFDPGPLTLNQTYFWRVDEVDESVDPVVIKGQVWRFTVRSADPPVFAHDPHPAVGQTTESLETQLRWLAGRGAQIHEVLLSANKEAIIDGSALITTTDKSTLDLTGHGLTFGTTYYWQVNGVNDLSLTANVGPIWHFATPSFADVDDMEGHLNDAWLADSPRWIDGVDDPLNGAAIIREVDVEEENAYEGWQSLKVAYGRGSTSASEVTKTFATSQDWLRGEPEILSLHFKGDPTLFRKRPANDAAPIYVTIQDALGQAVRVDYPDSAATQIPVWTEWQIPMTDMSGLDLSQISSITLGMGGQGNTGKGTIYFDNIRIGTPSP